MNNDMDPAFEAWATGFGGMDGGNLAGQVWFCGIEWGAEVKDGHFAPCALEVGGSGAYSADGSIVPAILPGDFSSSRYDMGIAKVCSKIWMGESDSWADFMQTEMCAPPPMGRMFKMNLYPWNFPGTNDVYWDSRHRTITGFVHKVQYRAWCMKNRFPFLRSLMERYAPRVIVCTGKEMTTDFRLAFAPAGQLYNPDYFKDSFKVGENSIESFAAANGKTRVLVSPFFGYGHMNGSNLELLGKEIRDRFLTPSSTPGSS